MSPDPAHKWLLNVQPEAQEAFDALSHSIKQIIFRHLRQLLNADDPYSVGFVQMIKGRKFRRIRKFRVGDYRLLIFIDPVEIVHQKHMYKGTLFLLDIRDRKEAY